MKTIFTEHPALMIVLQSVVLLALAFAVINVLMARRSAGTRHLAWVFSMGALLALPALWQVLPGWGIFPSPGGAASPTVTETDDGPAFVPALARTPAFDDLAPAATPKIPATDPVLLPPAIPDEGAKTSYLEWLGAIWLAGVGILLVRLLLSRLFLAFAARKARLVTRGPLFEEVESVRAKIGIGRKIRLCLSPATAGKTMPMTWGVFRPVLILPTEIEDWGSERTAVLQHELAHIRRWDAATHLLVQTACALYWFNPLVWLAARRIHLERERACDDFVLRSQAVKPSAYADCLLRILTGLDAGRLGQNATACAIAMSAPGKSQLEKRLQTITADGIDRRPVSTWSFALVLLAVVSLVLPVAMLRAADEKEKNPKPVKEKPGFLEPAADEPKVLDPVPAIVSGDFVYIGQKNGTDETELKADRIRLLDQNDHFTIEAAGSFPYQTENWRPLHDEAKIPEETGNTTEAAQAGNTAVELEGEWERIEPEYLRESKGKPARGASAATPAPDPSPKESKNKSSIRIIDERGLLIKDCEIMSNTAQHGYSHWEAGETWNRNVRDRLAFLNDSDVLDVFVRADGFATAMRRLDGNDLADLREGRESKITLRRGNEVKLELNVPEDVEVPETFLPQTYFPQLASRVRSSWQPVNGSDPSSDFNMLNVERKTDRSYLIRITEESMPFFLAIDSPGWLKFCEFGPFSPGDIKDGILKIDIPRSASIAVGLDIGAVDPARLPFAKGQIEILWPNPEMKGSYYSVTDGEWIKPGETREFPGLGPGPYRVTLSTQPREGVTKIAGSEINPGKFFAETEFNLAAAATHEQPFHWKPFDPDANRGDGRARLQLRRSDGKPAAGVPVTVRRWDGHYGARIVHQGQVPDKGIVQLDGISWAEPPGTSLAPYKIELNHQFAGRFRLQPTTKVQEFEFRVAAEEGELAPEVEFLELDTGRTSKLSDFRGKIVVLEGWTTWCGPCQPAMKKMNQLALQHADWKDRVEFLALSADSTSQLASDHIAANGWTELRHLWSPRDEENWPRSAMALGIVSYPTVLLLKPDGTIAWKGHPITQQPDGKSVSDRIEALLASIQ